MMSDKLITEQLFSVYFAPEPTGDFSGAINGQVTFGGLPDSSLYSGSIQYVPLLTSGTASVSDHQTLKSGSVQPNIFTLTHTFFFLIQRYWGIPVSNVKVGSSTAVSSFDAIVDTGTTLIILSTSAATAVYKKIKGSKYNNAAAMWEVPCKSLSSLPTITFTINGQAYPLTPEQYTVPSWEVRKTNISWHA